MQLAFQAKHQPAIALPQLKEIEQQHAQVGTGDRHSVLTSLREKEAAMQASSVQLFGRRLQLLQDNKSLEVSPYSLHASICKSLYWL